VAFATLLFAGTAQQAKAQVSVSGFFVAGVPTTYGLFVNNGSPLTLALVTISVPAQVNAVTNLSAPNGFQMVFDSDFGTLDLLEDADIFTQPTFAPGSTVGIFQLQSELDLNGAAFTALDVQGNPFTGTISLNPLAAPEPGTLALALISLPALGYAIRRRK
jgi:hypothetical protein